MLVTQTAREADEENGEERAGAEMADNGIKTEDELKDDAASVGKMLPVAPSQTAAGRLGIPRGVEVEAKGAPPSMLVAAAGEAAAAASAKAVIMATAPITPAVETQPAPHATAAQIMEEDAMRGIVMLRPSAVQLNVDMDAVQGMPLSWSAVGQKTADAARGI